MTIDEQLDKLADELEPTQYQQGEAPSGQIVDKTWHPSKVMFNDCDGTRLKATSRLDGSMKKAAAAIGTLIGFAYAWGRTVWRGANHYGRNGERVNASMVRTGRKVPGLTTLR